MYIDIHNHALYGVDDGADTMEEALAILREAYDQGAQAIVLTPHYRHGMFSYPGDLVQDHYIQLQEAAKEIGISIYLGCEYHVDSNITEYINSGRCHSLADSDYVLTEYSYQTEYAYMTQYTKQLISCGYIPVIAHVERYECLLKKPCLCKELKDMGALIQINADSVIGLGGRREERFCRKVLKHQWADVIASDTHGMKYRKNHMAPCAQYVGKKYGTSYERLLFYENPKNILAAAP